MNMLRPVAEKMLREHGEFYPYGGAMMPDGAMQHFAAPDGTDRERELRRIECRERGGR